MSVAVAEAVWIAVRCPCRRSILLEIHGYAVGPPVRRRCPCCRGWWVIDLLTGKVRGDDAPVRSCPDL